MRALAKTLRARASEHPCNFCEQFEQRPYFASTFKLNETIRYPFICFLCLFVCLFVCFFNVFKLWDHCDWLTAVVVSLSNLAFIILIPLIFCHVIGEANKIKITN